MTEVYTYLTKDVVDHFDSTGSESLLQIFEGLPEDQAEKEWTVAQLFTELLLAFHENRLELDPLVLFLYQVITNDMLAQIFCQVLNVFPSSDEKTTKLILLLSRKDNVIKPDTIAMYITPDLLKESGVVPKDVLTKSVNNRIRDEFYTQKKYNLLHEEIEGYSKLIVELYAILKSNDTEFQIDYTIQVLEKLIGHYSLDPNRCLDILLEVYSSMFVSNTGFCIELLHKSRWWPKTQSDNSSIEKLSVGGSEIGAKLIGLKFMKYPKDKELSETFKILTCFLIKEGFVSFGSIFEYLGPDDDEMAEVEKEYKKNLDEQVSKAGANALALAAPLAEEEDEESGTKPNGNTNTSSAPKQEPISLEKRLQSNLKYQMLKVLLGNGLYWPSIFILTKYPFLAHVDDEVSALINRIIDSMISPLYNEVSPYTGEDLKNFQVVKKVPHQKHNYVTHEDVPFTEYLSFKPLANSFGQKKFVYFYTTWNSDLPKLHEVNDLLEHLGVLLKFNGVNLSKNIEVFMKLCHIIVHDLKNIDNEERKTQWYHFFRNYIFPPMATIEENSIAIESAYSILSFYSIEDRFSVYGELYQVLAKNNPHIKIAYNKAEKSTKDILKRLSKENVRPMMRRLAKISFSNPLPCFLTILQQIESYDNLITLVVETARYFNDYGWDTLTLAILMRLTALGRSSVQDNGMNERKWLQSLASFIGKVCLRYPNFIDLSTILTFLLKSFHSGDSLGVIVLREILISMGGIQTILDLTLRQINLINCGSTLEKIVYRTIDDVRYDRFKSGKVLVNTFLELDSVNELLVLLCQLSKESIIGSDLTHLKVLASKNDDLESVIHLFTTLIKFFGDKEEVRKVLLGVEELNVKYGVPIRWIFELWRPLLSTDDSDSMETDEIWSANLVPVIEQIPNILPGHILEHLSAGFFVTFWQLSLYDINFNAQLYDDEVTKLKSSINSLKETTTLNSKNKDISKLTIEKAKKELRQNEEYLGLIPADKETHRKHDETVMKRLDRESSHWFLGENLSEHAKKTQAIDFLQYFILPRSIHSSFDAGFTAKFLFKLWQIGTRNFSLIGLLNEFIEGRILFSTLFTLTPSESENLGLFFADVLKSLHNWTNADVFEKEVRGKLFDSEGKEIDYDRFRGILYNYHDIILKDVGLSLKVTEYMSRRNAITFLKNLLGVYPNVEEHCEEMVKMIQNIATTEEREDLKLSSSALIGHVKSRAKEWVHKWDFMPISEEEKAELIEARKRAKEKEEAKVRQKKLEEQKLKAEAAKKQMDEEKKKRQSVLNYDSANSTPSGAKTNTTSANGARNDIRGETTTTRGRYDNYSSKSYGVNKKEDKEKERPKESQNRDSKKEVSPKPTSAGDGSTTEKADLKAKLLQAKKDYQEKNQAKPQRTPLPPQEALPKTDKPETPSNSSQSTRYNRYNESQGRFREKSGFASRPPPARPSSQSTFDRKTNDRKSYQDKEDRKPPYQDRKDSYQDRKPPANKPGSKSEFLAPPPPPPPPPPLSLKPRADKGRDSYKRDGYNGGYNRSYDQRDQRDQRDRKRPADYNRGYDKKSRYS